MIIGVVTSDGQDRTSAKKSQKLSEIRAVVAVFGRDREEKRARVGKGAIANGHCAGMRGRRNALRLLRPTVVEPVYDLAR